MSANLVNSPAGEDPDILLAATREDHSQKRG
jgi:hypothetical protein